jgi:hypothetical protein
MLASMRPSEFGLWCALYKQEPWGEQRADLRAAINTSVLANVNRNTKKKHEPFTPLDFMPYAEKPRQSELNRLRGMFGNRIKPKGK